MSDRSEHDPYVPKGEAPEVEEVDPPAPEDPPAIPDPDPAPADPPADPPADVPLADLVPDGGAAKVEEWVGTDVDRAQAALEKEALRDKPRSGLTAFLEGVIAGPVES